MAVTFGGGNKTASSPTGGNTGGVCLKSPCDKLVHFSLQHVPTCASSNADLCANCDRRLATSTQAFKNCGGRLARPDLTLTNCDGTLARFTQTLQGKLTKSAHCPQGNAHNARLAEHAHPANDCSWSHL